MKEPFVISDVHGEFDLFVKLLNAWDRDTQKLFLLGDYIDRGPKSLEVVNKIMELKQAFPEDVVVLRGNHDDMFLDYIQNPNGEMAEVFLLNGGETTLKSFFGEEFFRESAFILKTKKEMVLEKMEQIKFLLDDLELYHEYGPYLFVHAGVSPYIEDWRNTEPQSFMWIRNGWKHKNETGKIIVFGHTPSYQINRKNGNGKYNYNPYISPCKTYIAVDGGAVFGGQLNGVLLKEDGSIINHSANKDSNEILITCIQEKASLVK